MAYIRPSLQIEPKEIIESDKNVEEIHDGEDDNCVDELKEEKAIIDESFGCNNMDLVVLPEETFIDEKIKELQEGEGYIYI